MVCRRARASTRPSPPSRASTSGAPSPLSATRRQPISPRASSSSPPAPRALSRELAQDVREDPAVADVLPLARRVEPDARLERDRGAAAIRRRGDRHLTSLAILDTGDRERLAPAQPERLARLALRVLKREDPHHQQVRAVDPLVALRDHRAHAEQVRALRRPVA